MRSLRLQILGLTVTRTVINTMQRMVYPFLPAFNRGLGVDLQTLSLALTLRSAAGMFGPLLASIADSRGRKAGLIFGLLFFTSGTGLVVFWPTFPAFLIALTLAALGKLVFDPSMQAYMGDQVPYERRGLAIALTELSWSLAFIIGIPLAGFLISRGGWMAPFPLLAILGLISIVALFWLLPADPTVRLDRPSLSMNFRSVLIDLPSRLALLLAFLVNFANESVNLVFGVWMEESFGLQIMALGAASVVIGLSELGGESLVGALSDRLGKERSVATGLVLNSLSALALPLVARSIPGALAGLFFFYMTFEFTLVSLIPMLTEILPTARATLMAAATGTLSLGRAMGTLLAPQIYFLGFQANAVSTMLINLLALVALAYLVKALKARKHMYFS